MRRIKNLTKPLIFGAILVAIYSGIFVTYMGRIYPIIGHDFSFYMPRLIDTYLHYSINGLTIQWYTPSFGGGVPAYANMKSMQFLLVQLLTSFLDPWLAISSTTIIYIVVGFFASYFFFNNLIALDWTATINSVSDFYKNGRGFTGRDWQSSQAVAYVRNAPAGTVIYSNQGMVLYFLTNRPTYDVPEKTDVVRNMEREGYTADLNLMKERLAAPGSFLVWFIPSALPDTVLQESGVEADPALTFPDARIYVMSKGNNNP